MKGLLVRVGIDSKYGKWNGPVDTITREFVYVPIPECEDFRAGFERSYNEIQPALEKFGRQLPGHLVASKPHLDPDFSTLTYGDTGARAKRIRQFGMDDLIVFYAGLKDIHGPKKDLVYALIGLYAIKEVVMAKDIPQNRWVENAHTRRVSGNTDIVVRARPELLGRLERCIPIGEYRNRAYRVKADILEAWGGLVKKDGSVWTDGYIHRSGSLPEFRDAEKFYEWFKRHDIPLVQRSNLVE